MSHNAGSLGETCAKVRRATARDREAMVETLVSGFARDPLYRWLYPDDATRQVKMAEVFDLILDVGGRSGSVWVLDDVRAVAVWTEPGVELVDAATEGRYADLLSQQIGQTRAQHALAGMAACAAHVPAEPHHALHSLAVHGDEQGRGLGSVLLACMLLRSDRDGRQAHLDSSNVRNVGFYQRHGFAVAACTVVPGGGPTMRTMLRAARHDVDSSAWPAI